MIGARPGVHVDPVHADRPAQRRVVGHGVGPRARRQAEAAVQEPVPNAGGGEVVAEPDDLEVVGLPERDTDRQVVRQRLLHPARIGRGVEGVHVSRDGPLGVRHVEDCRIVRVQARGGGVHVGGVRRRQEMILGIEDGGVSPEARVVLLPVGDDRPFGPRAGRPVQEVGDVGTRCSLFTTRFSMTARSSAMACRARCFGVLR